MAPGPASPDVWICDLAACGPRLLEIERADHLLTDAERNRAGAITDPAARDRWIAAHAALHLVLRSRIGRRVRFAPTRQGVLAKPRVDGWEGNFSLAHSGNVVLIAVTPHGDVGIDVEIRRAVRLDDRRRRLIMAAGDATLAAQASSAPDDEMRFLAAWTRLEAIAKARGGGIGAVLEALGFHAADTNDATAARAARHLLVDGTAALAVHDIDVGRFDAVAALAQSADCRAPAPRDLADALADLAD